jgi:hypothetical protein
VVDLGDNLAYVLAESLIEPFFVTAGFALYLSRRVMLEGWDVELGLRRLARRLEQRRETRGGVPVGGRWACCSPALRRGVPVRRARGSATEQSISLPHSPRRRGEPTPRQSDSDPCPIGPAHRAPRRRATIVAVLEDPVFGSWLDARTGGRLASDERAPTTALSRSSASCSRD